MKTFDKIQEEMKNCYGIAKKARATGVDIETEIEIKQASDLAARTEGLVGPPNSAERIRELIKEHGRDKASLKMIEEIIEGKFGGETEEKRVEQAIRTAITMLTEGILVAGTEGVAKIEINKNPDNSKYLSLYFASPIRSAGGTAAGLAVMVADYARKLIGLDRYKPKEEEVARYVEEIALYNNSISRLQYNPSEDEIKKIISNCPVCVDGEPTSITEVSVYKNLDRVKTNCVRGGMCLVVAEGLAQKAPKLLKFSNKYEIGWNWLESLVKVIKKTGKIEIQPITKYLKEVVGGRPIFAYPSTPGGFRLRYGRARNTGINSRAIHPASMEILDEFPVIGTQLKIERPKKGCALTPCDNIEPPVVLMKNGDVVKVKDFEEAKKIKKDVKEILFIGDMLVPYGDFLNANHPLIPSGIVEEWWNLIVEKKGIKVPDNLSAEEAIGLSRLHQIPLHPKYTYFYNDISKEQLVKLINWLKTGKKEVIGGLFGNKIKRLILEMDEAKRVLELICFPHKVREGRVIIEDSEVIEETLGLNKEIDLIKLIEEKENSLEVVNALAGFPVYNKAPVYIGARMGRPEKSKERKMNPAPNGLFPVGNFGGKTRSVEKAAEKGKITLDLPNLVCDKCGKELFSYKCECGGKAVAKRICINCGKLNEGETCKFCGEKTIPYHKAVVDLGELLENTLKNLGEKRAPEKMKGVIGTISDSKFFEPLEKLVLRAKNDVWCFKDGTARIDATNLPLTHFKPREIHLTVEEARALGYEKDYLGNDLINEEQIVELWPQDVVISETAADYFIRVCNFIDDELVKFYKLDAYYNVKQKEDLIGKLVVGMAPHISAGTLGRIIGFTKARGTYAHPYFHGATRRDCDGDENSLTLLMDALINFSKKYLPSRAGATEDIPLILSTKINPAEVDDQVWDVETINHLPLEFYEAAEKVVNAYDIKIPTIKDKLGKEDEMYNINFMFDTYSIDEGPHQSNYTQLGAMSEKVERQLELAEKIRAVDEKDVAKKIINSHFLRDIYGNLRSFGQQSFRCVDCNAKYRRVPLTGKCTKCGGKLLLTVHRGGIEKYLKVSQQMAKKYGLGDYLEQRLKLIENDLELIFESEKSKQYSLSSFM